MSVNSRITENRGGLAAPLLLLASAIGVASISSATNQKERTKTDKRAPNIIVILADDLGYGDLSCYGATKISTPVIDKLAANGVRFTNAYASSSLSSPSRYNLLTGRYAWRTRLEFGVLKNYERPLIEKGETTIASFLKRNGYFTACIGKWHLGLEWALNSSAPENPQENVFNSGKNNLQEFIDFSKPVTGGPVEVGFDYFYGMSGSNNMQPYVFIENDRVLQPPTIEQTIEYDFYSNAKRAPDWDIKTVNQVLTNKAVQVIETHFANKKDMPLFLYFPTSAIHRPCLPTFTKGMSRAGLRGDIVVELDWTVGEIIKALKKNGVYENTLIVFTSDNGPRPGDPALWIDRYKKGGYEEYQEYFGDFKPEYKNENGNMIWKGGWLTYGHSSSGELLGFKQDPSEGGIRVPFIFHWPNRVKHPATNSNLLCVGDLLATFSEILGENLKEDEGVDSYSFLSYLTNNTSPEVRKSVVLASGSSGALIAIKDGWKYIEPAKPGRWPETYYEGGPGDKQPRLFNLSSDISEQNNLINRYPQKGEELIDLIREVKSSVKGEANK